MWFISELYISVSRVLFPIFLPYYFNIRFLNNYKYQFKLKKYKLSLLLKLSKSPKN